jgi:hypothetical protein
VTALRHIDHGVTCDHTAPSADNPPPPGTVTGVIPCGATVWQSERKSTVDKSIRGFRNELRQRGWQLGVLPETLGITDRQEPLDFCPAHRKDKA